MWFQSLFGFSENSIEQVQANLSLSGNTLTSKASGKTFTCGTLNLPSLAELREQIKSIDLSTRPLQLKEVVADVQDLHANPNNAGAFFQAASQFNLLEMISPDITPEMGIDRYENDHTQGPACAIACGAGTVFRNYFTKVNGQTGQTAYKQIDCLKEIGDSLNNTNDRLWTMTNGYALPTLQGLQEINQTLQKMTEAEKDLLRAQLRIGVQKDTQVTMKNCEHLVTQAYCSALPVAYSQHPASLWADFAKLILEASYEATLAAALLNAEATGNRRAYLTLLGGGAFGNQSSWIFAALQRAIDLFRFSGLDIALVSYGTANMEVDSFIQMNA